MSGYMQNLANYLENSLSKNICKVSVVGHFAFGGLAADGQTVKTRTVFELVQDACGSESVRAVDTYRWRQHPFSLIGRVIKSARSSEALIFLPAQNGIKVFGPLMAALSRIFKCHTIYSVIGGWLPDYLNKRAALERVLKQIDIVLVETQLMADKLKERGFSNVRVIRNCKHLVRVKPVDQKNPERNPIRLVFFARVERIKGVEDAIWAVSQANRIVKRYTLDIYGRVGKDYAADFNKYLQGCGDSAINYKGCIDSCDSASVLDGAAALLFPTRYLGEGVPGSVIDAFCAGVPVIASRWPSCSEVVIDGNNGLSYDFCNRDELLDILLDDSLFNKLKAMKVQAYKSSEQYCYESGLESYRRLLKTIY